MPHDDLPGRTDSGQVRHRTDRVLVAGLVAGPLLLAAAALAALGGTPGGRAALGIAALATAIAGGDVLLALAAARRLERGREAQASDRAAALDAMAAARAREEALHRTDAIVSVVSHELRTPLQTIRLALDLVERGGKNPEKIASIRRSVDRMHRQVEDLLEISRLRAGRLQLHPEPLDLYELVRDLVLRMDASARGAGCIVHVERRGNPSGTWDKFRVETIVSNLLGNALKFGAGRPIDVTVEALPAGAAIEVRDRGIGVPLDRAEQLFEPFERGAGVSGYAGFGLGLWIGRQLARAMGGSLTVSEVDGGGSRFRLQLPFCPRATPDGAGFFGNGEAEPPRARASS